MVRNILRRVIERYGDASIKVGTSLIHATPKTVNKASGFVGSFLCALSAGTASACGLQLVLVPQESAQSTDSMTWKLCDI